MTVKPYPEGVYAASLTWFKPDEAQEVDWNVQTKHLKFLVDSGLTGLVVAGSNGEAVALTLEERIQLVKLAREIAGQCGKPNLPIIAGTVGQTTKDVISQLKAYQLAGADFGLVLTPDYFHFAMSPTAIQDFFTQVAEASPIPIVIYSWPLVTSGLELNSDILSALGRHPNIVAVKLTCGGIAKLVRLAAEFKAHEFCGLSGFTDWLLPGLAAGSAGSISGFANLCPRLCMNIYTLYQQGRMAEARELQGRVARAEWWLNKTGINGTKWVVAELLKYGETQCATRRPYPEFTDQASKSAMLAALKVVFDEELAMSRSDSKL